MQVAAFAKHSPFVPLNTIPSFSRRWSQLRNTSFHRTGSPPAPSIFPSPTPAQPTGSGPPFYSSFLWGSSAARSRSIPWNAPCAGPVKLPTTFCRCGASLLNQGTTSPAPPKHLPPLTWNHPGGKNWPGSKKSPSKRQGSAALPTKLLPSSPSLKKVRRPLISSGSFSAASPIYVRSLLMCYAPGHRKCRFKFLSTLPNRSRRALTASGALPRKPGLTAQLLSLILTQPFTAPCHQKSRQNWPTASSANSTKSRLLRLSESQIPT